MLCPRTDSELKNVKLGGVSIDYCESCGGVWFDNFELKKFDEVHEAQGVELIKLLSARKGSAVDLSTRIKCPRDTDMTMMRRLFSPKSQIEIDECPKCAGIWLDAGELLNIHTEIPTDKERSKAISDLVLNAFSHSGLDVKAKENAENLRRAKRFANIFRWICPSNYLPGKQDWGAF